MQRNLAVMNSWPHLTRAPIVEGLIDIRVEQPPTANLAVLEAACEEIAPLFPSRKARRQWSGRILVDPQSAVNMSTADEQVGFILQSADEKDVAQFRFDGFTYSRLHPYTDWQDLRRKSFELWGRYRDALQPEKITRVATRYINRIPIRLDESLENQFKTTFRVSEGLPQQFAGFLLRVVLPFDEEQATAIVTQTLDADRAHCIFDIDVFSEDAEGFDDATIWSRLDLLRDIKNRLFFGSLTSEALEAFQ